MHSKPVTNICKTFCDRAVWTWRSLRNGINTGIELGEETLTDINLLEIQIRHPKDVRAVKFNRIQEGNVTGADWEWWFGSQSGWIGLRVQAKKLNSSSLKFDSLNHKSRQGKQVDLLVNNAQKHGLVPMYCFYNYWNQNIVSNWTCGAHSPPQDLQGCMVSSASHIMSMVSNRDKSLQSVLTKSLPWSCLVCCEGYSGPTSDLTERVNGVLNGFWQIDHEVMEKPPRYVSEIMRGSLERAYDGLAYILVVTEGIS